MRLMRKYRKLIVVCICLLVTLISMGTVSVLRFRYSAKQTSERLDDVLGHAESRMQDYDADCAFLAGCEAEAGRLYARLYGELLKKQDVSVETLDHFKLALPEYSFCYVNKDGTTIADSEVYQVPDLYSFLKDDPKRNTCVANGISYNIVRVNDGWLAVGRFFAPFILVHKDIQLAYPTENVLCWDLDTEIVLMGSTNADADIYYEEMKAPAEDLSVPRYVSLFASNMQIGHSDKVGYYVYKTKEYDGHVVIMAYAEIHDIIADNLRGLCVVLVMILLVAIAMCLYALRIMENDEITSAISKRKLWGKISLKVDYFYHLTALLVVCICIVVVTTAYIHLLTSFSEQNLKAQFNLNGLTESLKKSSECSEKVENSLTSTVTSISKQLAYVFEQDPDLMRQDLLSSLCEEAEILSMFEISVFDGKGVVETSNLNNVGYMLDDDEESAEFEQVTFLREKSEHQILKDDAGVWSLFRRKDAPGIIRVSFVSWDWNAPIIHSSEDYALFAGDFAEADRFIYDSNEPDVLLTRDREEQIYTLVENNWPELKGMKKPYTGIHTVNGRLYYVNTVKYDNAVIVRALPIRHIILSFVQAIVAELLTYFFIYGVLLLFTACTFEVQDDNREHHQFHIHSIPEKLMDDTFKRCINLMVIASLILLVTIFALDGLFAKNSLTRYLLSTQWEPGVNLFSFTKIFMMLLITLISSSLIQKIIMLVARGMSNRGITVGHLLSSTVKFGALIFIVVYSLVQFGVKLSSLLAGAGFAGAALAFAGQNVVEDLLSGFFVVFEGKYGVGDWVTVGDFRGQIVEIGVRTTSVALGDDIKIFHNSSLSGITVWSHAMSGAICNVEIAYRENIERVVKIIQANTDRYMREIPEMEEPPMVLGVMELGRDGIVLRMTSHVSNQENAGRIQRRMLQVTKRIFDENDISIPFSQVVIHQGEADVTPAEVPILAFEDAVEADAGKTENTIE